MFIKYPLNNDITYINILNVNDNCTYTSYLTRPNLYQVIN